MAAPKPVAPSPLDSPPDRDIADPLEAARQVVETGKPITPENESAKHPVGER